MEVISTASYLNLFSNKIFKYDMLVNKNGEFYVEPTDRVIVAFMVTFFCTLLYLTSFCVFSLFSATFK